MNITSAYSETSSALWEFKECCHAAWVMVLWGRMTKKLPDSAISHVTVTVKPDSFCISACAHAIQRFHSLLQKNYLLVVVTHKQPRDVIKKNFIVAPTLFKRKRRGGQRKRGGERCSKFRSKTLLLFWSRNDILALTQHEIMVAIFMLYYFVFVRSLTFNFINTI